MFSQGGVVSLGGVGLGAGSSSGPSSSANSGPASCGRVPVITQHTQLVDIKLNIHKQI